MCGICGEINFHQKSINPKTIRRMCDILAYRGPDDEGMVFTKDGKFFEVTKTHPLPSNENGFQVGLGPRRLSIIDLSSAVHQPMCKEDGKIWIVLKGGTYNFHK